MVLKWHEIIPRSHEGAAMRFPAVILAATLLAVPALAALNPAMRRPTSPLPPRSGASSSASPSPTR